MSSSPAALPAGVTSHLNLTEHVRSRVKVKGRPVRNEPAGCVFVDSHPAAVET